MSNKATNIIIAVWGAMFTCLFGAFTEIWLPFLLVLVILFYLIFIKKP
jgi:hypothetical protein